MAISNQSLTMRLSEKLVATKFEDIPTEATEIANQCMLDAIGTCVAGASERTGVGRITKKYVRQIGGNPECSVVTGGFKIAPPHAAYANGTLCHALDYDNTAWPRNHPASPTIPAILAMAEKLGSSGAEVLRAIVLAFEVQLRMRVASARMASGGTFHHPGISGPMGAVAGVGTLLGLDAEQFCMAFGNAGSRAGTTPANHGTMTKPSHSGIGAQMGTEAAMLASLGWTASSDIFGEGGFFDAFYGKGNSDPEVMMENFGDPYRMVDPGVSYKLYPAKYSNHRAIEAAIMLAKNNDLDPKDIASVDVDYPPTELIDRPNPKSGLDGKFSIQYGVAAGLLDRHVGISTFTDKRRFADDMEAVLPKISIHVDDSIPADLPSSWIDLKVTTVGGKQYEWRCDKLQGMAGVPISRDTRLAKFHDCVSGAISKQDANTIVATAENMAEAESVHGIMDILREAEAPPPAE